MPKSIGHILLAGLLLLALAACGAEDGDLTPPDVTFDGGVASPAALLTTDIVSLSGTMSADATIDVDTSSAAVAYNLVQGAGVWTCDVTGLVEGENIIYVTATDPVGNNRLLQISIVVDLTGPLMTIDQYQTPVLPGTQVVAGTVSELGSSVSVDVVDGGGTTVIAGVAASVDGSVWYASVDMSLLGTGTYTLVATGIDPLNNSSDLPAVQAVDVDTLTPAPALAVSAPVLPVIGSASPVQFSGSVDPLCPLTYNGTPVTVTAGAWGPVDVTAAIAGVNIATFDACGGGSKLKALLFHDISPPLPFDVSKLLPAGATTITVDFAEEMSPTVDIVNLALVDDTSGNLVALVNAQAPTSRSFDFTTAVGLVAGVYSATLESFDTALIADARGNALGVPYTWKIRVQ